MIKYAKIARAAVKPEMFSTTVGSRDDCDDNFSQASRPMCSECDALRIRDGGVVGAE